MPFGNGMKMKIKQILTRRRYKKGFEVRTELWEDPAGQEIEMVSAYNLAGDYIGTLYFAFYLIDRVGVLPELASPEHRVCSVGFNAREQKWYGWSHRYICGFGIGDMLFDQPPDEDDDTPFTQCGTVPIETLAQARQAAVNFAAWATEERK